MGDGFHRLAELADLRQQQLHGEAERDKGDERARADARDLGERLVLHAQAVGDMVQVAQQSGMSGKRTYVEYTITYPGDKLPPAFAKGLTIKVQADPATGEDWAPDRKAEAQLNELFDRAFACEADRLRGAGPIA